MLKIILILQIFYFCESFISNNIFNDEMNCLNELPIKELIKIRKSLDKLECNSSDKPSENHNISSEYKMNYLNESYEVIESRRLNDNDDKIIALPLVGDLFDEKTIARSYDDGNEHHHQVWDNPKPTKLETVFQISITALSFLAFGGYLLCMIVQAIKSKGTTYFHPVATAASQTNGSPLKKIKVYRRQRRSTTDTSNFYNHTNQMALPNPNEMYKILILFSEGYVKLADIN